MEEIKRLTEIMTRLRGEGGCPWDKQQTHLSLKPYLIEEAYEVLEAIDAGSPERLQEELGDLLLQIVFHAQIAKEEGYFDLEGVARAINEKLIRRHPHVFGERTVASVEEVLVNWERLKENEYGEERASALAGVPIGLPALMRAQKLQAKAAKVGFDWPDLSGALAKLEEELREFRAVLAEAEPNRNRLADEFGDLLFALVNVARFLSIDAEEALRQTTEKFCRRFHYIEEVAKARGRRLPEMELAEMDELWEEAKKMEEKETRA
ncbi:MAG: nucleoside triphosphate pyrophosphohydrolase [Bacillota bacterium]